jgi:thiol-disulfide isomerase/thioredoxin
MNKTRISKQLSAALFAAAVFCAVSCLPASAQDQIPREVAAAFSEAGIPVLKRPADPVDFSLPLLGGGTARLSAYRGKAVMLNFWATWCPPCREEMPSMEALYQRFAGKGLEILAVDCSEPDADVAAFIGKAGYSFPVVLDSAGGAARSYAAQAIPATYILDRGGKIIARVVGSLRWDNPNIIAAFETLLKQ